MSRELTFRHKVHHLFRATSEHFEKGKRQNTLREGEKDEPNDIQKIIETYKYRRTEERYSRKVSMEEIETNGYNLNISRYVSTSIDEVKIDLKDVNAKLTDISERIAKHTAEHNQFLKELGLDLI